MMPALPGSPRHRSSCELIISDSILSTIPARHRERDSGSLRKLSTIGPYARPRLAGITVHDALESLSSMSRNNHGVRRPNFFCRCRLPSLIPRPDR